MRTKTTIQTFFLSVAGLSGSFPFRIFVKEWSPTQPGKTKGIVQIAHGMRESTDYYEEFCEALTAAGYGVYINDARGHGRTAGEPGSAAFAQNAGYAGEDGFHGMESDLVQVTEAIRRRHPGLPIYLLGHSMGSVLARLYAGDYGDRLAGLLYSGTTGPWPPEKLEPLLAVSERETAQNGERTAAAALPEQLFAHFNDRFAPAPTGGEYMTRDEAMMRAAQRSPAAKIGYTNGFYRDFLNAIGEMDSPARLDRIPKNLPVFSVSGSDDPFGDYGDGVRALFALYREQGFSDIGHRIYEGGRHEMLRETNRAEVFADIIAWLDAHSAHFSA